jgi:hypothetical protein
VNLCYAYSKKALIGGVYTARAGFHLTVVAAGSAKIAGDATDLFLTDSATRLPNRELQIASRMRILED